MGFGKPKQEEPVRTYIAPNERTDITTISKGCKISGKLNGKCDIEIEGEIEGNIEIDGQMKVLPGGRVVSESLHCRNAEIAGSVEGPMTVYETLQIRSGGVVTGDIAVAELLIEQGGGFNGNCRKLRPEEMISSANKNAMKHAEEKKTSPT